MTEPSDRRFCPQCGKGRAPAALFCESCGARLAPGDVATATGAPSANAVAGDPERMRVEALLRREDLDGAAAALDAALTTRPDDPDLLALQAHILLERVDVEGARAVIDRALAIAPGSAFARLQLADYWLRLGVTPRAREELQRALASCGDDEPALEAHLRRSIAQLRDFSKSEFGRDTTSAGFGDAVAAVTRLFQTKRKRRRRERLAAVAATDERGA